MSNVKRSLEDAVLRVFEYACQQHDLEVAEHLLCALEAIAGRGEEKERLESALLTLARTLPRSRVGNFKPVLQKF